MSTKSYILTLILLFYLNTNIVFTLSNNNDLWDSLIPSSSQFNCSDQCVPGDTTLSSQCNYIKTCCSDTLGSGSLINYLTMQYCFFNTVQPLGVFILAILVFYAFLILGNVADDYFAPTMAELADFLGVSHELAGVTFVAFGNGAPDISSSVAAITQGGDTTKLGLGALLGAAVFDPIAVSGAIAIIVNNPKVARRPFLRDCFFLFIAAACVLYITSDQKVHISEALGMVLIYVFYVGSVLLGEIYKKLRKKKHREAKERRKTSLEPPAETITDKIMPVLGAFSNDSMRDLFENKKQPQPSRSIEQNKQVISNINSNPSLQNQTSFLSRQESTEIPYIQDLYHQLEEEEEYRKHLHKHSHDKKSLDKDDSMSSGSACSFDDDDDDDDISSSSSSDGDEDREWWKSLLLYLLRGPTLLIEILCKITIPLTDKNWNDWTAISSCITAPIFIQFAFIPHTMFKTIGQIPIVAIVAFMGLLVAGFTFWRVKTKYVIANKIHKEMQHSLLAGDLTNTFDVSHQSITTSMASQGGDGINSGLNDMNKSGGALLHSSASIFSTSMVNNSTKNGSSIGVIKEVNENVEHKYDNNKKKKKKKKKKKIDLTKKPVMKFFFLMVGFLSAVAWIEVVANELVNLLTTLGVISTIDLALLGLTVLAWGNSIGDMIADVSVSKRGYAKMGISAAIGGPTLNVLIGVGLGTTINTLSAKDGVDHMPDTSNIFVCCIAVMIGILIYAIWTAINKWTLKKTFGYFCFVYYFAFLAVNILVYENVIPLPFGS